MLLKIHRMQLLWRKKKGTDVTRNQQAEYDQFVTAVSNMKMYRNQHTEPTIRTPTTMSSMCFFKKIIQ